MNELSKAVALSGALDPGMVQELVRWRLPVELPDGDLFDSPEEAIEAIETAIESKEQVELRTTDLDLLKQYLRTQRKGKLHLENDGGRVTSEIQMGITTTGAYIVPWRGDDITEILTNRISHIVDGRRKIYIEDVKEFYFGHDKNFIICFPDKRGKVPHAEQ